MLGKGIGPRNFFVFIAFERASSSPGRDDPTDSEQNSPKADGLSPGPFAEWPDPSAGGPPEACAYGGHSVGIMIRALGGGPQSMGKIRHSLKESCVMQKNVRGES